MLRSKSSLPPLYFFYRASNLTLRTCKSEKKRCKCSMKTERVIEFLTTSKFTFLLFQKMENSNESQDQMSNSPTSTGSAGRPVPVENIHVEFTEVKILKPFRFR